MKNKAAFLLLVVTWTGLSLVAPGQSVAQSLARPSGLYVQQIQLAQGRNQRTLSLHFSQSPDSVHAFALRSPARLVIDVRGEVERSASATYTASDALIRRVRVGSHPHHTRFVLDLKTSQLPPFSVAQQAQVVTAVLSEPDEPDDPNDDAEQADGPQQGDAQVLLARVPEAGSPHVPPRPTQAPVSPAPTILAKKVTQQSPPSPLRRATPPAAAPHGTPDTAGPAQATPLPSPSKELRAAVPLKDPPLLLARVPEAGSPHVPPRPTQAPVSPAPTVLAKNVAKKALPPLRVNPPAAAPHGTPDTAGPAQATPLPSPSKELRAAVPLKDPPLLLARVPEAGSPHVPPRPTQAPVSPAPTVLAKNVAKKALPPLRVNPPAAAPHGTPDTAGPAQATPLPSPSKELRAAVPLKDPPLLLARVPEASSPHVPPRPTQAPVSPAPTVLAKNVAKKALPPLRVNPPAAAPHGTPDTAGPAQATPLPSPSKELRAAVPLKDPPLLLARVPEAGSPHVPPRPTQAPVSPAPTVLAKKVTQQSPPSPLRRATPPAAAPRITPDTAGPAQATPLPSPSKELRAAVPLKDPPPSAPLPPAPAPAISSQDTPQPSPVSPTASQHLRQGYTLYNQGNLDGAIRQWRKAIHQAPTHAEAHYRIGVALQERGELAQAITAFREAARLNPADATIHIHLARACEAAGSTQDALAAYRKALQLVPTSAHVHHRVGHLLAAEGNLMGAMQAWRQTIQLQPDYAYAYVSLGRALGQAGQTGEALAAYERALRLDPRAPFGDEVRQQIARLRTAEP